jgi:hypothetical protein
MMQEQLKFKKYFFISLVVFIIINAFGFQIEWMNIDSELKSFLFIVSGLVFAASFLSCLFNFHGYRFYKK